MSKHSNPTIWPAVDAQRPAHVVETLTARWYADDFNKGLHSNTPYTPGKHAKPFGKHHPATPIAVAPRKKWLKARTLAHIECSLCNMKDVAA